jgi:hypothetical protein
VRLPAVSPPYSVTTSESDIDTLSTTDASDDFFSSDDDDDNEMFDFFIDAFSDEQMLFD